MGVKIPDYTDGKVLNDLFSESFFKDNPIQYTTTPESQAAKPESPIFSDEEKEKIEKRLKDLGYM
jgi:hypothetical protein